MRLLSIPLLGILQACIGPALAFVTSSTDAGISLQTPVIAFESLIHGFQNNSIYENTGVIQSFYFNATGAIDIQHVLLIDHNDTKTIADSARQLADDVSLTLTQPDPNEWRWEIGLDHVGKIFDYDENGNTLFFEVVWNYITYTGTSYSGAFTFANTFAEVEIPQPFYDAQPIEAESISSSVSTGTSTVTATQTQGQMGLTSTATSATSTSTSPSSGVSQKSTSHHKGLKGGAIAGVVIGVVAGLAAIALVVWFFFSRRHRHNRGYSSPQHARSTGPDAAIGVVPHSSGGDGDDVGVGAGLSAGAGADADADVDTVAADVVAAEKGRAAGMASSVSERDGGANSPYSDDFDSVTDSHGASNLAAAGPGASLPVVSGHVAALIEDGMTPEDVARLAAEEMELDAAIHSANLTRAAEAIAHQ